MVDSLTSLCYHEGCTIVVWYAMHTDGRRTGLKKENRGENVNGKK